MMQNANSSPSKFPGMVLRAWCYFTGAGALVAGANVSSVTRNSLGNYTVVFTSPLPTANMVLDGRAEGTQLNQVYANSPGTAQTVVGVLAPSNGWTDANTYVGFYTP